MGKNHVGIVNAYRALQEERNADKTLNEGYYGRSTESARGRRKAYRSRRPAPVVKEAPRDMEARQTARNTMRQRPRKSNKPIPFEQALLNIARKYMGVEELPPKLHDALGAAYMLGGKNGKDYNHQTPSTVMEEPGKNFTEEKIVATKEYSIGKLEVKSVGGSYRFNLNGKEIYQTSNKEAAGLEVWPALLGLAHELSGGSKQMFKNLPNSTQ